MKNNTLEGIEMSESQKEQAIGLLQIQNFLENKLKAIKQRKKWASELSGVDYTNDRVQTYNIPDPTAEHAVLSIMQEPDPLIIQYILNNIKQGIEKLPPEEKKLIKLKYDKGNTHSDEYIANQMYMSRGAKFHRIKNNAIKLFALYTNILSFDFDENFVQFSEDRYFETLEN